jgi:hypothetical protein
MESPRVRHSEGIGLIGSAFKYVRISGIGNADYFCGDQDTGFAQFVVTHVFDVESGSGNFLADLFRVP